jgi:hypothetical protein
MRSLNRHVVVLFNPHAKIASLREAKLNQDDKDRVKRSRSHSNRWGRRGALLRCQPIYIAGFELQLFEQSPLLFREVRGKNLDC